MLSGLQLCTQECGISAHYLHQMDTRGVLRQPRIQLGRFWTTKRQGEGKGGGALHEAESLERANYVATAVDRKKAPS